MTWKLFHTMQALAQLHCSRSEFRIQNEQPIEPIHGQK